MKYASFKNLESGKRYTVFGMSEWGFPYQMHITLLEVQFTSYAQYNEAVKIIFKRKGGRSVYGKTYYGSNTCFVFEGWVTVDTEMFKGGNTSYASFDDRYMEEALASVNQKPVAWVESEESATMFTYKVVVINTLNGMPMTLHFRTKEALASHMEKNGATIGQCESRSVRQELRGQPQFSNLCGPMWDGKNEDGYGVIRYECKETNARMSD